MPMVDATAARRRAEAPSRQTRPAPEFPGCRSFTLKREDLETFEGRIEYWDGDTETAWQVCEPTSPAHEHPSQLLAGLAALIAQTRGSPIRALGTADLMLRDEQGAKWRILQADQCLYLHPERAGVPGRVPEIVVGEHDFPDVVLEVDHTTDVCRGKLWLYEGWGFPEVWVEVPEARYPVKRPAGVSAGLTIYVLAGGVYRKTAASRAFHGWTAEEIHAVMNESEMSPATGRMLRRVGRTLGRRKGTGPDDLPWLRMERREARAQGMAQGERTMLTRMAAVRFGEGTAARLSELLACMDDARLRKAGEAVIESTEGAELLDRAETLAAH